MQTFLVHITETAGSKVNDTAVRTTNVFSFSLRDIVDCQLADCS